MDLDHGKALGDTGTVTGTQRRQWTAPRLSRLRAGDAELTPTGVSADGHFSSGS